ncbi:MAG: hypothetical protein KIT44_13650 [Opitutaceae bacterium]|nr:hypothetical protein [Opitutaceae bacterium]
MGSDECAAPSLELVASRRLEARRANLIAAGFAGATIGSDFYQGFAQVDENMLRAAGDLFNIQIATIGDLSAKLDGIAVSAGLTAALKGRVAEHVLADRLAEIGATVSMAESFNQKGWDLLVDGVPVNPKLYADAAHAAGHFARFPDIPVILPADAINLPTNALYFDSVTGANFDAVQEALSLGTHHLRIVEIPLVGQPTHQPWSLS